MRAKSMGRRRLLRGAGSGLVASGPAVTVLAACGAPASPVAGSSPAPAKKQATVVVHSRAGTADHSAFQQTRIPLFKEQFPHIEVRYEDIPGGEMRTKLLVLAAGGSIGDLAWNGIFVGSHELLAKGVFQPVERVHQGGQVRHQAVPRRLARRAALPGTAARPALPRPLRLQRHLLQRGPATPAAASSCPPADANWTVDDLVDRARKLAATGRRRVRAQHRASRSVAPPGCAPSAASCSARTASGA